MIRDEFRKLAEFETAAALTARLREAGFKAYFVGGCVRDMLRGKTPKDIDIATSATPEEAARVFPHHHEVGVSFGVLLAVENGFTFEIATLREEREYMDGRHPEVVTYTDDLRLDAARRDFTVNAMFYDPFTDEIIDFFGGKEDLENGILRCVGDAEQRFNEDYLRMLRAVRFAVRFGFEIDPPVRAAIEKLKSKVARLSSERVRQELTLMLTGPRPSAAVELLSELGLLAQVLPEVEALHGVEQPPKFHPEGDVFVHTMLMLDHMALPTVELAWSVLLHDVGKPSTRTVDENGISHFYSHEREGAICAARILKRLRFPGQQADMIVHAVENHMRFASVHQMRYAKLLRMMAEPGFIMELELHRLDCLSSNLLMGNFVFLLDVLHKQRGRRELPRPLLTGKDLIKSGARPGPDFGRVLKQVEDCRLDGLVTTREEALALVKKLFADQASKSASPLEKTRKNGGEVS